MSQPFPMLWNLYGSQSIKYSNVIILYKHGFQSLFLEVAMSQMHKKHGCPDFVSGMWFGLVLLSAGNMMDLSLQWPLPINVPMMQTL